MILNNLNKLLPSLVITIMFVAISTTTILAWPQKFNGAEDSKHQTKVSLVCPYANSYKSNSIFEVGLIFNIPEKSHIYGSDGGKTGLPTTINNSTFASG